MKSSQSEQAQAISDQLQDPANIPEEQIPKFTTSQTPQDTVLCQQAKEQVGSTSEPKIQDLECKTPLKIVQEIEPFKTVKPCIGYEVTLESPQVQVQTEALVSPADNNSDPKSEILKPDDFTENDSPLIRKKVRAYQNTRTISSTAPSSAHYNRTPSFKGPTQSLESTAPKKPVKRQFWLVGSPPLYTANKRVKMNKSHYKGSVELLDKLRDQTLEFRVFKDRDLGNTKAIQNRIRYTGGKADDDCPTDSEQIEYAKEHGEKDLQEALYTEKIEDELAERIVDHHTVAFSSKSQTDAHTYGTTSVNFEDLEIVVVTSEQENSDRADSTVVKQLSFNEIE